MAYDEAQANLIRDRLAGHPSITERKMFGSVCFMLRGNMLCGVHRDGGMVRVGKANHTAALEIDGVTPLSFTRRPMGGMVDVDDDALADPERWQQLMDLALDFVGPMPAK